MVSILKKATLVAVGCMTLSVSAEATAVFARQYDMKCSSCHIGLPPALNATGQQFYRNGFKFSGSDKTTIDAAGDGEVVPLSVFLGVRYKNGEGTRNVQYTAGPKNGQKDSITKEVDETDPTFKIMSAGSINKNLSYFAGAKFAYMDDANGDKKFTMEDRKIYLMYNSDDTASVSRVGSLSPYALLGNIKRSVEASGISSDLHITPLVRAGAMNRVFGFDYSYKSTNGFGVLASAGTITENTTDEGQFIGDQRMSYVLGLDYYNDSDFRASFIATHVASIDTTVYSSDLDRTVFMIPVEYSMDDKIFFNVATVYEARNNTAGTDGYLGVEAAVHYEFMENALVRAIISTDDEESKTYAFKYAQMFNDNIMLGINVAKTETNQPVQVVGKPINTLTADATSFGASLSYVY